VWVRDEPVVDFGTVHSVLPESQARGTSYIGIFAEVGTARAAERCDFVLPVCWEYAAGVGGGQCGYKAGKTEGC
jgi:hypothetical protein